MATTMPLARMVAALATICMAVGPIAAQPPSPAAETNGADVPPNPDPKDLQGDWQAPPVDHAVAAGYKDPREGSRKGAPDNPDALRNLPLTEAASAKLKRFVALTLKGTAPVTWRIACRPGPPQRIFADDLGGAEIFQSPTEIIFLFDTDNSFWRIYLDRDHPANLKPSYYGHSIGRWDGNALVVDTIGYNGRTSVVTGVDTSEKTHMTTRLWKADGGRELRYQISFEDPVNFTAPVNLPEARMKWAPEHRLYEEHCTQSTREENYSDMVFSDFTREEAFPYLQKK